jgi:broad specificity phosphatase PhoE
VRLYLIRHGETAHNREGLGLGRADVPLTEHGRRQVVALGQALAAEPFDRIFSSPLGRAMETAEAVAGSRPIPIEPRDELLELDVGETEGMTFAAMRERFPDFLSKWAGPDGTDAIMPAGESIRHMGNRLVPFVRELRTLEAQAIAIVSHNFVTRVLLCLLLDVDLGGFRAFAIGLSSYCVLDLRQNRTAVVTMNEGCHLDHLESVLHPA